MTPGARDILRYAAIAELAHRCGVAPRPIIAATAADILRRARVIEIEQQALAAAAGSDHEGSRPVAPGT
jgi:hypothetical protein